MNFLKKHFINSCHSCTSIYLCNVLANMWRAVYTYKRGGASKLTLLCLDFSKRGRSTRVNTNVEYVIRRPRRQINCSHVNVFTHCPVFTGRSFIFATGIYTYSVFKKCGTLRFISP